MPSIAGKITRNMPNIATALRSEITRLSRKEVRVHHESLAKASRHQRTEIAALKRRVHELESLVKRLSRDRAKSPPSAPSRGDGSARFSAKGLASNRKRLGLSAGEYGKLIGVSGNTIYNWENGSSKPRSSFHLAIAELRGMGKRQLKERLDNS